MHKVSRMTQTPAQCLHCGRGNTPDDPDTLDDFYAVDLERDVNWGDSTYVCKYCCMVLAEIAGYVDMASLTEQMNENQALAARLHEEKAAHDSLKRRHKSIVGGAKTLKKEKKKAGAT